MGTVNSAEFDSDGRVGENRERIRSAAMRFTFITTSDPRTTPANGYQFTLVGNAVDGSPKWGITVHRSHYGLVQD